MVTEPVDLQVKRPQYQEHFPLPHSRHPMSLNTITIKIIKEGPEGGKKGCFIYGKRMKDEKAEKRSANT